MTIIAFCLRLLIAPLFFILAIINFKLGQSPDMATAGHAHMNHAMSGGPDDFNAILASMWLMYALMGLAHITPWFALFGATQKQNTGDY